MYYSIGGIEGFTKAFSENSEDSEHSEGLNKSVKDLTLLRSAFRLPPESESVECPAWVRFCTEDETPASTQPCPCQYRPGDPRLSAHRTRNLAVERLPNIERLPKNFRPNGLIYQQAIERNKERERLITDLINPPKAPSHGISKNTKLLAAVGSLAIGLYFFLK